MVWSSEVFKSEIFFLILLVNYLDLLSLLPDSSELIRAVNVFGILLRNLSQVRAGVHCASWLCCTFPQGAGLLTVRPASTQGGPLSPTSGNIFLTVLPAVQSLPASASCLVPSQGHVFLIFVTAMQDASSVFLVYFCLILYPNP